MVKFATAIAAASLAVGATAFLPTPSHPTPRCATSSRSSSAMAARGGGSSASSSAPAEQDDPRRQALDGVMLNIERCYGRGSILKLGDTDAMEIDTTSTGSLALDMALGGGLPRGRVVEIYGPESSGKTTLALHALAEIQKGGGTAAFIDAEHALDPSYAGRLGVDVENLLISQPDSGEMALDVVDQLVRSAAVDMVVVDSVAALVPRAELEGDMGDMQMGLQARLMSKALRKVTGSLAKSQCTVVFINQLRSKIGVIYGSPEVTSGGNALKYYSSVRLDVRRKESLRDNSGITVRVKVAKNKVAPPFRTVELDILFGTGMDSVSSMLDAAEGFDVVQRKGSWYRYNGQNLAQGRLNAVQYLKQTPELCAEIEAQVRAAMKSNQAPNVPGAEDRSEDLDEDSSADSSEEGLQLTEALRERIES